MDALLERLDRCHARVRGVRPLHYWTWFVRAMLAIAFLPSGVRKVSGERFAGPGLGEVTVMFDSLYDDFGMLYGFIGLCQITAALLLLVPRTAALGAAVYLPIAGGIVVITTSLDFGPGTSTITVLLQLGAVYLLCWDWHRVSPVIGAPGLAGTRPAAAEARAWE